MNEIIRQLAEQAGIKFEAHPHHPFIDTAVIIPSDLKKFAELLLKECIAECRSNDLDVDRYSDEYDFGVKFGVNECVRGIKTRFGVEE